MRFLRTALWIVAIGAVAIWVLGLAHGFKGVYCFNSTHTCTSQDLEFQGHVVVWLAPVVFVVSIWLLRAIKRYRLAQYSSRMVTRQVRLEQQATRHPDSTGNGVVRDGTGTGTHRPRHAAPQPDSGTGSTSTPRHAAQPPMSELSASSTERSVERVDYDTDYDLTEWTSEQRTSLTRLLDATGIPFSLRNLHLLVDRRFESEVDDILDSMKHN